MPQQFVKPPYKFYSHHRETDTWTVMFINKPVLTEKEVKLFFSKYGEVVETQFVKEACFVGFKSKEIAKRCATDLKNNGSIRLRPFRWAVDYDRDEERSDDENVTSSGIGKASSQSSDNSPSSDAGFGASKENSSEVKSPSRRLSDGSQNNETGIAQFFTIDSPLIIEHVQAQEVIVANIPESCGVNLILDLFREFRPICASNMKIIMGNSLRYCHVYFETQRQAREVELIYDNAQLHGKRIIVLRSEALAAHAFVS